MVPMNMEVKQEIVPSLFRESNLKPLSLYISAVKIVTGAEGVTRTPFCFTGFFTAFAKTPIKSHFSLLHYPHGLHRPLPGVT